MNLIQFKDQAYHTAVQKGFWEEGDNRNRTEQVTLMITELSEAVEAHRKAKTFDKSVAFLGEELIVAMNAGFADNETLREGWIDVYQNAVKDTLEAELAGTAIRLLDYFGGWNIQIDGTISHNRVFKGNFSEDIFHLMHHISTAHLRELHNDIYSVVSMSWSAVLAHLVDLCRHYNVDIERHVRWELTYFGTRPYKHQKAY